MNRTVLVVTAVCLLVTAGCSGSPATGKATPSPSPTPHVVLDDHGKGSVTTGTFTVSAPWEMGWGYQCSTSCTFVIDVMTPSGGESSANPRLTHTEAVGQGVQIYHTGGTFFLNIVVCCSSNSWTVKVVG